MTALALSLGFIGAGLFLVGFVRGIRGTETWRRVSATSRGYFWLPCPSCGAYFGGNEVMHGGEHNSGIPTGPFTGQCICPTCTLNGVGDRAWARFYAEQDRGES